jgi:hypothetical protein
MRKIILTFVLILVSFIITTASGAGCVVIDNAYMYYDADRFFKVARVCAVHQEQGKNMIMFDVANGDAVFLPKGTQVDAAKPVPNSPGASVIRKGNILLMGLTEDVRCN